MDRHIAFRHSGNPQIQCKHCLAMFNTYNQRKNHATEVHKELFAYMSCLTCCFCRRRFNSRTLLAVHVRNDHQNAARYPCARCPVEFGTPEGINAHARVGRR